MEKFEQSPNIAPENTEPTYVRPLGVQMYLEESRQAGKVFSGGRRTYVYKLLPTDDNADKNHLRTTHITEIVETFDAVQQCSGHPALEPAVKDRVLLYLAGASNRKIITFVPGLARPDEATSERATVAERASDLAYIPTVEAIDRVRAQQRKLVFDFLHSTRSKPEVVQLPEPAILPVSAILDRFEQHNQINSQEKAALQRYFTDSDQDLSPSEYRTVQRFLAVARVRRNLLVRDGAVPPPHGREWLLLNTLLGSPQDGRSPQSRARIAQTTHQQVAPNRAADDDRIARSLSWLFIR